MTYRTDPSRAQLVDADELGHEARSEGSDHAALKLWLRLLACTTQVEDEIRRRLRKCFGISLPRFDYLAQLYRQPDGLKMKDLSRFLMVTGGNVTGLTDELEREGLVQRESSPTDGRSWIVRLTPQGRDGFAAMAQVHEQWILELFSRAGRQRGAAALWPVGRPAGGLGAAAGDTAVAPPWTNHKGPRMSIETVPRVDPFLLAGNRKPLAHYAGTHFKWVVSGGVATLTLNRPRAQEPAHL